jgi:hypothetical protein
LRLSTRIAWSREPSTLISIDLHFAFQIRLWSLSPPLWPVN